MAPTDSKHHLMDADVGTEAPPLTCRQSVLEELKPENIAPCHHSTRSFVESQWSIGGKISTIYLVYRVTIAVLLVTWIILDFFDEAGRWYSFDYALWFIFATNWSLISIVVVNVMMAVSTTYYYVQTRVHKRDLPSPISLGLSIQWVVYNIAYNSAIVVSVSYWTFVLVWDINDAQDFMLSPMSQLKHSLNSVFIVIDLFANAIPIRVYHLVYPLVVGLIYAIFNATYFLTDNRGPDGLPFAYAAMDWRFPFGSTLTCILGFLLSCFVQLVLFGLYKLRLFSYRRMQAAVAADVDGYSRRMSGVETSEATSALDDDERGPIFPNGFDLGGNGGVAYHANAGYQSIQTAEHVVNGK